MSTLNQNLNQCREDSSRIEFRGMLSNDKVLVGKKLKEKRTQAKRNLGVELVIKLENRERGNKNFQVINQDERRLTR